MVPLRSVKVHVFLLVLLAMLSTSSCYYDNAEQLYGTGASCDSVATWTNEIQPLIQSQCVNCHQGTAASGGLDLSNHLSVQNSVLNGSMLDRINRSAGDPLAMPPGGPISECSKAKVRVWKRAGALPN
jgi:hypothetical protein